MYFKPVRFLFIVLCALAAVLPAVAQPRTMTEVQLTFAPVVREVGPAVVNIFAEKVVNQRLSPFGNDPLFERFFGSFPGHMRQRVERSLGSGVIVTPQGHMITNAHVVEDARSAKIVFNDGREADAKVVAADKALDIAVLKIDVPDGERLPFLQFGDADLLEVGDLVLAVGNPYGVGQSVSMGIVSALGRTNVGSSPYQNFIQTDAAINPGNSGGALVNTRGELVGVNTAIFSKSGGHQGIGFATPANSVQVVLESVLATGKVERPWFGGGGQNLTSELAERLGLPSPNGALINDIVPDGPAAKAGLKIGDIVTEFDGYPVRDVRALNSRIALSPVGRYLPLKIWREGREVTASIRLSRLPERNANDRFRLGSSSPFAGVVLEQLSPALNQQLGLALGTEGVAVVEVPATSAFSAIQFRPGDILENVNGEVIRTLEDAKRSLSQARPRGWEIVFNRGGKSVRLVIR